MGPRDDKAGATRRTAELPLNRLFAVSGGLSLPGLSQFPRHEKGSHKGCSYIHPGTSKNRASGRISLFWRHSRASSSRGTTAPYTYVYDPGVKGLRIDRQHLGCDFTQSG